MAKERTPDPRGGLAEPPSEVQITVLPDRDGRALRERIVDIQVLTRACAPVVAVLVVAAIVAIVAGGLPADRDGAPRGAGAQLREGGPRGVAAAYGYPVRCLSVTISANDSDYARADFDRRSPCGRYDGYVTAIFHRVGGTWRPALDAVSYSCPLVSLPPAVQAELDVCPQTDRPAPGLPPAGRVPAGFAGP
jgi:hypothetical protein